MAQSEQYYIVVNEHRQVLQYVPYFHDYAFLTTGLEFAKWFSFEEAMKQVTKITENGGFAEILPVTWK